MIHWKLCVSFAEKYFLRLSSVHSSFMKFACSNNYLSLEREKKLRKSPPKITNDTKAFHECNRPGFKNRERFKNPSNDFMENTKICEKETFSPQCFLSIITKKLFTAVFLVDLVFFYLDISLFSWGAYMITHRHYTKLGTCGYFKICM